MSTSKKKNSFLFSILAVLFAILKPVSAATFNVLPAIVFITPERPIVELKLTNDGDDKINFQAKLYAWTKNVNGVPQIEPSNDVVFFPRIFTVHPHRKEIIRIGVQNPQAIAAEKSYRIYFHQLPSKVNAVPGAVQMVVNVSVPIFVMPPTQVIKGEIEHISIKKRKLDFSISNPGNVHLMEHLVSVVGTNAKGKVVFQQNLPGWYVLAGQIQNLSMKLPPADCRKAKKITILVVAESQILQKGIDVPNSKIFSFSKTIPIPAGECGPR